MKVQLHGGVATLGRPEIGRYVNSKKPKESQKIKLCHSFIQGKGNKEIYGRV